MNLFCRSVARAGYRSLMDMRDSPDSPDFQYGRTADGMPLYNGGHISSGNAWLKESRFRTAVMLALVTHP